MGASYRPSGRQLHRREFTSFRRAYTNSVSGILWSKSEAHRLHLRRRGWPGEESDTLDICIYSRAARGSSSTLAKRSEFSFPSRALATRPQPERGFSASLVSRKPLVAL